MRTLGSAGKARSPTSHTWLPLRQTPESLRFICARLLDDNCILKKGESINPFALFPVFILVMVM